MSADQRTGLATSSVRMASSCTLGSELAPAELAELLAGRSSPSESPLSWLAVRPAWRQGSSKCFGELAAECCALGATRGV